MKFEGPPAEENDGITHGVDALHSENKEVKKLEEKADEFFGRQFAEQDLEQLSSLEIEKNQEQIELIIRANNHVNELRSSLGLARFDIPPENIHIMPSEAIKQVAGDEGAEAVSMSFEQMILVPEIESPKSFFRAVTHEMIHFSGHQSYTLHQSQEGENFEVSDYRSGLKIKTKGSGVGARSFEPLNEAITEIMAIEITNKASENALFEDEDKELQEALEKYKYSDSDEALRVVGIEQSEKSKGGLLGHFFSEFFPRTVETRITWERFRYEKEREIMWQLIDKVAERTDNPEYQSREKILNKFKEAYFGSSILPFGRLVDESFGKGTLRKIGELGDDIEGLQKYIDSL